MKKVNIEIKLYSFDELSKDAKEKAIERLSDINVDHDWWETIYEDAKDVGLKIHEFDQYYHVDMEFIGSPAATRNLILENHGKKCNTYKVAEKYKDDFSEDSDSDPEDRENEFLRELKSCYKTMLMEEYDYMTSEEAIKETIDANDYLFFDDGTLAHCTTYVGKHPKAGITEFHYHGKTYEVN